MHKVKEYKLEGKLKGISDRQIQEHRDVLYKGYVDKLNMLEEEIKKAPTEGANATYATIREMKREEIYAANGAFLHEAYFGNLGGGGGQPGGKLADMIKQEWGSFDKWLADMKASAMAARGWAVMCWSFNDNKLHNYTMDFHDIGAVWNCVPLLVLDVYEHAYMIDYGVKRAAYLEAFFQNIDWNVVEKRLQTSLKLDEALGKAA
jgi:superoxide dismutase, Fe-Mn family